MDVRRQTYGRTCKGVLNGNDSTARLKTDIKRINIRYFFSRLEIQVERFQISICKTEQRFDDNLQKAYKWTMTTIRRKCGAYIYKVPTCQHPISIKRLRRASSIQPSSDYAATTGIMPTMNRTPILKYIYPAIKKQLAISLQIQKKVLITQ